MTYGIEIKNLFIDHHRSGKSLTEITSILKVSLNTLKTWLGRYTSEISTGQHITQKSELSKKVVHGSSIKHKYATAVIDFVNKNEGCSLAQICTHINHELSFASVCRLLKQANITRKRYKPRIVVKDLNKIRDDRKAFAHTTNSQTFMNSISIDESSFCVTDMTNYGYSTKGKEIKIIRKHKKNKERYSLLMAVDALGNSKHEIIEGSFNSEKYLKFFTDNLDFLKGKQLYQDNVRFHHAKILKSYASENNIGMNYVPAYTPEFNPIELVFSKLKAQFRKLDHLNIKSDITASIAMLTPTDQKNCFSHSLKEIIAYKN